MGGYIKRAFVYAAVTFILLSVLVIVYFSVGNPPPAPRITWGVNFSQKHTEQLGLDWRNTYLAVLDDWGVKNIKIATHWDYLEPADGSYNFDDLDWQIQQAEDRGVKILLVIGMKTPRWPECHIPQWATVLNKEQQQQRILRLLETVVSRYQNRSAIWAWQVENEPMFPFGECPWADEGFLKEEIIAVKTIDQNRPIVISDSGEGSLWWRSAALGDIVSITLYRRVWFKELGRYITYPFRPMFYWRKAQFVKNIFGKKVIGGELQAEPWGPQLLYVLPLKEQEKTMNLDQFRKNISFAKQTGLDTFYLWGAEWMYWMKTTQEKPELWNEAKKLFQSN